MICALAVAARSSRNAVGSDRKHADAMVKVVRNAEFELEAEAWVDKVRKNAALGAGALDC